MPQFDWGYGLIPNSQLEPSIGDLLASARQELHEYGIDSPYKDTAT